MFIGVNELEIEVRNASHGLRTNVLYSILPGEPFAELVRQVVVTNVGPAPRHLEMLDGLPRVMLLGVSFRAEDTACIGGSACWFCWRW